MVSGNIDGGRSSISGMSSTRSPITDKSECCGEKIVTSFHISVGFCSCLLLYWI